MRKVQKDNIQSGYCVLLGPGESMESQRSFENDVDMILRLYANFGR